MTVLFLSLENYVQTFIENFFEKSKLLFNWDSISYLLFFQILASCYLLYSSIFVEMKTWYELWSKAVPAQLI